MPIIIDNACCIGCGICVDICPESVIDIDHSNEQGLHELDEIAIVVRKEDCTNCGLCITECPAECIELDNEPSVHQMETEAEKEDLKKDRLGILEKIIKRYVEISISDMCQLLKFEEEIDLKKWLIDLPDHVGFEIRIDTVYISSKLQDDSSEAQKAIDELLKSFSDIEYKSNKKL